MQKGSLRKMRRHRGPDVWAYRWREPGPNGNTVYRNLVIGTVEELPTRAAAFQATVGLRRETNPEDPRVCNTPMTMAELVAHYRQRELRPENTWKTFSTRRGYDGYLKKWILPRWGTYALAEIKSGEVESWLHQLTLARSSCSKIRNLMSTLFNHARRHDLFDRNPITWVRQSAKRRNVPEILTAQEIGLLLAALAPRERTLVLLDIGTGLRMSELFALRWNDVDFEHLLLHVSRSIVYQVVGNCKTEASQKAVPLHRCLAESLKTWRQITPYAADEDWIFASPHSHGGKPYWGQALMRQSIRPALRRVGIGKRVGWHTFRHSVGSILADMGEHQLTSRDYLRHSNLNVTNQYLQATSKTKRLAQEKLVDAILPSGSLSASKSSLIQ